MAYETESALSTGASNNTTATANLLTSGTRMTAALGSSSDRDVFSLTTDGAALITLDFETSVISANAHWQIRLLDSNGDYLRSLASSVSGSPVVDGANQSDTTLEVTGFSVLPTVGSRFTFDTDAADTDIYTIISVSGNTTSTILTLDKATAAPSDGAALLFDPAQTLTGLNNQLNAQVDQAGTYYVEVLSQGAVWNSANYHLTANVDSTTEAEAGDKSTSSLSTARDAAVDANNRLLADVSMYGNLASATDVDYWVFTTASGSDFNITFASDAADITTSEWNIDVTEWDGSPLPNNSGSVQAGDSVEVSVDDFNYPSATTFLVKVSAVSADVLNDGIYSLKISGTGLDINDAPVISMGSVSVTTPNAFVSASQSGVVKSIPAGESGAAGLGVALSSFFSVSDVDEGQTIANYKVGLSLADGTSASEAFIRVGEIDYGFASGHSSPANISLTAAQMSAALFYPGATPGNLVFTAQAFDSTGAEDDSGASAILQETLRIVGSDYAIDVGAPAVTALTEASGSTNFSLVLGAQPSADVKIYLTDSNEELDLSTGLLTFTASNWNTPQTVTVSASADGINEGSSQTASLAFQVISNDTGYGGFNLDPLLFTVSDPAANAAPVLASVTLTYTDTADADAFASPSSGSASGNLAGTDTDNDVLSYGLANGTDAGDMVSLSGVYGVITLDKTNGNYSFTPTVSAIEALKTTASESFSLSVSDGVGSDSAEFIVNLVGAEDPTSFSGDLAGSVTEDGKKIATGSLTVEDRDNGDAAIVPQTSSAGTYGRFSIETDGDWTYTLNNGAAKVQALITGQSVTDRFTVVTAGGESHELTMTINGKTEVINGTSDSEKLSGTASADVLNGLAGNDTLEGLGGKDTLSGGPGNDLYLANTGDEVRELTGEGTDRIEAGINWTLPDHVEDLALIGNAVRGTGNGLANNLIGNAKNNELIGLLGNDTLTGNAGNDTLNGGTDNDRLTGGDGNDSLLGGAGNDVMDGGVGTDTLLGGAGNDIYVIDILADIVSELSEQGTDLIKTAITYSLVDTDGAGAQGGNVEQLTLLGTKAINGTGNGLANTLTGNSAANTLKGLEANDNLLGNGGNDKLFGGAGHDTLTGGDGIDKFVFDTAPAAASNIDTIKDFVPGTDKIVLDDDFFKVGIKGTTAGVALTAIKLQLGATSDALSDRIVYDQSNGHLYYDADGSGTGAQVQIALLGIGNTHPILSASDFLMVA